MQAVHVETMTVPMQLINGLLHPALIAFLTTVQMYISNSLDSKYPDQTRPSLVAPLMTINAGSLIQFASTFPCFNINTPSKIIKDSFTTWSQSKPPSFLLLSQTSRSNAYKH
jgi:hypothetical protein